MSAQEPSPRSLLQEAVAHHQAGRIERAEHLYRQVLQVQPRNPDALHLLGVIAYQGGKSEAAETLIRQAIDIEAGRAAYWSNLGNALKEQGRLDDAVAACQRALDLDPSFATAAYNLGNALKDQGKLAEAIAAYKRALVIRPDYAEANCNLGIALREHGRADDAAAAYRATLRIKPAFAEAWNGLGLALHDQGKLDEAISAYEHALEVQPEYAEVWNNLGSALRDDRRLEDSVVAYRRAIDIRSGYAEAWCNLGIALRQKGEWDEAAAAYHRAIDIDPTLVGAFNNLGVILRYQGRLDEAATAYRRALELRPNLVEALSNLGEIYEKTNRLDELEAMLQETTDARNAPAIRRLAAMLLRRRGQIQEALQELAELPAAVEDDRTRQRVHFELGLLYDRDGQPDRAMHHFREGKRILSGSDEAAQADAKTALDGVRALRARFRADWVRSWRPAPESVKRPSPIFIVGFPRSGTTLLDQILDSHPNLQVMEEKPCIPAVASFLEKKSLEGYPDALKSWSSETAEDARRVYERNVARYLQRTDGAALVDKFPLNILQVGLIQRMFPDAKVLFAMRHPCDVCLSSFMQFVELNDAMANFLTLEDTVVFYDEAMSLWQQYVELLPITFHTVRYEALVTDFRTEVARVLDYLGLDWDDAVLDYAEHAKRRRIATPSYHQVTEPIYERSKYRWKRYEAYLTPMLDRLNPHVAYFGYGD